MVAISLNKMNSVRQEVLDRGRTMLQTVGERVATFSRPWVTLSGQVFSKDNWSRIARQAGSLWQEWTADPGGNALTVAPRDPMELYSPQGVKRQLNSPNRGLSPDMDSSRFRSSWPRNAYEVDVSEAARLAHGIVTHMAAPPDQRDDFIRHVQSVRKQGGYDPQVFAEARHLLNQFPQSVPTYLRDG
ncbi:MAG: hypothetical protein HQL77_10035 [Magnetococcales bacterium]|nr:hypothetical protein [Magnetococcales bacterium]